MIVSHALKGGSVVPVVAELFTRFWSDESGQGLVEYVLIIALVSVGLTAIMLVFKSSIGLVFAKVAVCLGIADGSVTGLQAYACGWLG